MEYYLGLKLSMHSGKEVTLIGASPVTPEEFARMKEEGKTIDQIFDLTSMRLIPPRAFDDDFVEEIRRASMDSGGDQPEVNPVDDINPLDDGSPE